MLPTPPLREISQITSSSSVSCLQQANLGVLRAVLRKSTSRHRRSSTIRAPSECEEFLRWGYGAVRVSRKQKLLGARTSTRSSRVEEWATRFRKHLAVDTRKPFEDIRCRNWSLLEGACIVFWVLGCQEVGCRLDARRH
jgi:hypothetical protein